MLSGRMPRSYESADAGRRDIMPRMDAKSTRGLIAILAAFTALAVSYSLVTRLRWGPDEPAHFIYIRSIATRFELPPISHKAIGTENSVATHDGHQPPLYYALMAIPLGERAI